MSDKPYSSRTRRVNNTVCQNNFYSCERIINVSVLEVQFNKEVTTLNIGSIRTVTTEVLQAYTFSAIITSLEGNSSEKLD